MKRESKEAKEEARKKPAEAEAEEQEREEEQEQEESLSVEEAFAQIEEVISRLEDEEITLEQSFREYNRGMELLRRCNEAIDRVEKKVLKINEDGGLDEF